MPERRRARRLRALGGALKHSPTAMAALPDVPTVVDFGDDESVRGVVAEIVPHAAAGISEIAVVSGGITNQLKKVTFAEGPAVLVRVFGAEGMIDRAVENPTFQAVTAFLGRPSYLGRFANGRVEGWLEGSRPLSFDEMGDEGWSPKIAAAMARLHKLEVPAQLADHYGKPGMWDQLWLWHSQASAESTAAAIAARSAADAAQLAQIDLVRGKAEMEKLQAAIPAAAPVAFCHNDLLAANVMVNDEAGEVTLIDFEYGGTNYRGFDIANHFNEWAGGTDDGEPDYAQFPTKEQQTAYCTAYLAEMGGASDEAAVAALVEESAQFVLADHWYWGLWAINQARDEGCEEFPYLTYAQRRIGQYYAIIEGRA